MNRPANHHLLVRILVCLIWACQLGRAASSSLVIDVGFHTILPNQSYQEIPIRIRGGTPMAGMNFGVALSRFESESRGRTPSIRSVDLVGGIAPTIFTSNHREARSLGRDAHRAFYSVTTEVGVVLAEGLLATVVVDTTGIGSGQFMLSVGGSTGHWDGSLELFDQTGLPLPGRANFGIVSVTSSVESTVVNEPKFGSIRIEGFNEGLPILAFMAVPQGVYSLFHSSDLFSWKLTPFLISQPELEAGIRYSISPRRRGLIRVVPAEISEPVSFYRLSIEESGIGEQKRWETQPGIVVE